jgi:CRP-like cAMP-binding protein
MAWQAEETCKIAGKKFLKKGEILFREGDAGTEVFVIESGKLRITKRTNGKNVSLAELGSGESVGEMAILLRQPRTATAEAVTDSVLVSVNKDACMKCISNIPPCAASMLQRLARRLGAMNEQLLKETFHAAGEGKDVAVM